MPIENIVVLALIVAMFVVFAVTLAWVSHTPAAPKRQTAPAKAPAPPVGARHA
ncbi:MAG: hypothetical protein ACM3JG_08345 [Thiohalocapsa sp.]